MVRLSIDNYLIAIRFFRTIFLIFTIFIFFQNCEEPDRKKYIEISVSSNSISYGSINVNQYLDKSVTVTNSIDSNGDMIGDISVIGIGYSMQSGGGTYLLKPGQSKTVTIRYSPTVAQTYSGTLAITHNSENKSSPYNVQLSGIGLESPVLSVLPTSLDFGTTSTSDTFDISNSGTGTLSWSVSESVSWITSVSPSSGTNSGNVTVQISRSGMSPGTHNGTISVTSDGGNQNVSVSMMVQEQESPVLFVSPTSLDFGTTSTSETFDISNSGTGTLNWNVSESVSWITSISSASGTNSGTVTVQISRSGMSSGTYDDIISVTSNSGNQSVSVSMTVPAESTVLSISPTSLDFGTTSTSEAFNISNSGTGTLSWSVSESVSWITSVSPSSGTNSGNVTVQISRSGMSPGTHNGTISVASNGGNQSVSVSMTVPAETEIVSTPSYVCGSAQVRVNVDGGWGLGSSPGSISNLGHSIEYHFDWGDGNYSNWLSESEILCCSCIFYSYSAIGIYNVRAQARCSTHSSIVSNWGPSIPVEVSNSYTFSAIQDSYVVEAFPDYNDGSSESIAAGRLSNSYYKSFIQFDISSIPIGAIVDKAELTLTRQDMQGSFEMVVKTVAQSWLESTITWNNSPITNTFPFSLANPNEGNNIVVINVKDLVEEWISGSRPNYGIILSVNPSTIPDNNYVAFASSENVTTSSRPKLKIILR